MSFRDTCLKRNTFCLSTRFVGCIFLWPTLLSLICSLKSGFQPHLIKVICLPFYVWNCIRTDLFYYPFKRFFCLFIISPVIDYVNLIREDCSSLHHQTAFHYSSSRVYLAWTCVMSIFMSNQNIKVGASTLNCISSQILSFAYSMF